jgi:EmrB/QacA subfamily drug resistance transporter
MSSSTTTTDPGFHPEATDRIEPYVWKIAGVVILGMIMSILDTTIVNVALRTLGHDLHSSLAQTQWVITGYLLSLAAVIPITGWAARRFGAKRVYLTSLVLFTIGSALCAIATTTTELVLFRVLQGAGGGMIMPIAQLIMAQVAGPKRMGRVMGIVAMPAMLGPILGPVLGGTILQSLHWSWIFLVNVPIGFVAFILGWRCSRRRRPPSSMASPSSARPTPASRRRSSSCRSSRLCC